MSLINDALNKVQRQRREKLTPEEAARYGFVQAGAKPKPSSRISPLIWVMINAGVLVLVLAANHFFFRESSAPAATRVAVTPPPSQPRAILEPNNAPVRAVAPPLIATSAPAPASVPKPSPAQTTPSASPFVSLPASTPESDSSEVEYDLAGMTVVGKETLLSITRRSDQRSFWVAVGKTVGEVTAVSYNPDADDALIRVRGRLVTIVMRNAAVYFHPVTPTKH